MAEFSPRGENRSDGRPGGNRYGNNNNRDQRGGPRRPSFSSGPREMHKAICAECGKECEVPFKPTGDKPVYCKECFAKHKPARY